MTTREWFRQSRRALFERSSGDAVKLEQFARIVTEHGFDLRCADLGPIVIIFTSEATDERMVMLRDQFMAVAAEYQDFERQILERDANDYKARALIKFHTSPESMTWTERYAVSPVWGSPSSDITH